MCIVFILEIDDKFTLLTCYYYFFFFFLFLFLLFVQFVVLYAYISLNKGTRINIFPINFWVVDYQLITRCTGPYRHTKSGAYHENVLHHTHRDTFRFILMVIFLIIFTLFRISFYRIPMLTLCSFSRLLFHFQFFNRYWWRFVLLVFYCLF